MTENSMLLYIRNGVSSQCNLEPSVGCLLGVKNRDTVSLTKGFL
jgi:hypothetical protein